MIRLYLKNGDWENIVTVLEEDMDYALREIENRGTEIVKSEYV